MDRGPSVPMTRALPVWCCGASGAAAEAADGEPSVIIAVAPATITVAAARASLVWGPAIDAPRCGDGGCVVVRGLSPPYEAVLDRHRGTLTPRREM
jgi:hypothetical protein